MSTPERWLPLLLVLPVLAAAERSSFLEVGRAPSKAPVVPPSVTTMSLAGFAWTTRHTDPSPADATVGAGVLWSGWSASGALLTVGAGGLHTRLRDGDDADETALQGSVSVRAFPTVWTRIGGFAQWKGNAVWQASVLTAGLSTGGARWSLVGDAMSMDLRGNDDQTRRLSEVTGTLSWCAWTPSLSRGWWLHATPMLIIGRTEALPDQDRQFSQDVGTDLAWDGTTLSVDGWIGSRANAVRYRGTVVGDDSDIHRHGVGVAVTRTITPSWTAMVRGERDWCLTSIGRDLTTADTLSLVVTRFF